MRAIPSMEQVRFGQSGTVADLYAQHDLVPGAIVNAALAALAL